MLLNYRIISTSFPPVLHRGTSIAFTSAPDVGQYGHAGIWPEWTFIHFEPHAIYIRGLVVNDPVPYFMICPKIYNTYHQYYSNVSYTFIYPRKNNV